MATSASTAPTVPASEVHTVAFSSKDAPITAVTVFCKNKAEVTRVVNLSSSSNIGNHEVELTDLPGGSMVDKASVRVKGSGHCTILHVSYSDEAKIVTKPELTEEEKAAVEAEQERKKQEVQRLNNELTLLRQHSARNACLRKFADSFAERTVGMTTGAKGANATVAPDFSNVPAPSVSDVDEAMGWWATKAVETDTEKHRLSQEELRLQGAINELRGGPVTHVPRKPQGRVIISIDVHELGPIELEVTYMIRGATWSPAYDLRVDTETDSISCTYFGRITQSTTEDWEDVALTLSTAEPSVHGTPPVLAAKTISLKMAAEKASSRQGPDINGGSEQHRQVQQQMRQLQLQQQQQQQQQQQRQRLRRGLRTHCIDNSADGDGLRDYASGLREEDTIQLSHAPAAKLAVAQVESGGGGIGAVSFVVGKPAVLKSNGQTKKLTVGEMQLSVEVTHYVVPSKEPVAYLQAKATNDTEYLLLASEDVSIFFGNSFATKTSLASVSPGETFQAFLGIDPSVKVKMAPPRKTSRKRGVISKSNQVTYTQSTSISNNKTVPVTFVVVDAMPRPTDEVIKVILQEPAYSSVSNSKAITDVALASEALGMFRGTGAGGRGEGSNGNAWSRSSSSSIITPSPARSAAVTSRVTGVAKSPSNHLAWVGTIAPQGELSIPFKYMTEWPINKEIEILEQ